MTTRKDAVSRLRRFTLTPEIDDLFHPDSMRRDHSTLTIRLYFKSLGDLVHAPVIVGLLRHYFPGMRLAPSVVDEEYNDAAEALSAHNAMLPKVRGGSPRGREFAIGCFDTAVRAYARDTEDYDYVIPMQFARAVNVPAVSSEQRAAVRRIMLLASNERVLTLASFSCLAPEGLRFQHESNDIAEDFAHTNRARFVPPTDLLDLCEQTLSGGAFDRLMLVPRNVSEEGSALRRLEESTLVGTIQDDSRQVAQSRPVLIVAAKGILRTIYLATDCAVVFGYHNVLEPFQAGGVPLTFCFEPPATAPNYTAWQCGDRLGVISAMPAVAPEHRCKLIARALEVQRPEGAKRRPDYWRDPYAVAARDALTEAMQGLQVALNSVRD